jgi:hypothetical protein
MRAKIFHAHNAQSLARRFAPAGHHLPSRTKIIFLFFGIEDLKNARKNFSCTQCTIAREAICTCRAPPALEKPKLFFLFFGIEI